MAYTADIVIAVKGATQITNLQQRIQSLSAGVNSLNATLRSGTVASLDNFNKLVSQSDRVMRSAAQGTRVQKQAIDTYVRSVAAAEKAENSLQLAIQRRRKELGLASNATTSANRGGGRLGGAISGAVIGGSFPLLFGQGGGAAAGGAIGGLLGGLTGPGGSFAGSLLGTLIGDIASKGKQIKELAVDIGFSVEQTRDLQEAFKLAGQDADKFTAAVQNIRGLGLSIEDQADAIRLVSQLTETYGGRIDKVTSAFANALESGKVTQATLNQLTNEGIGIQDALAQKYGLSRDAILQMAKDGQISVQTLADVLVNMGNKGIEAGQKPKSAFDQFTEALGNTATAVGNVANALLTVLGPAIDTIILKAAAALNALTETINTELLRTRIQGQTGKIISPERLRAIEEEAMGLAARRYPSQARGNQLAAGANIISPRAQQEFQILREQGIRNELQRFGYEQGILRVPTNIAPPEIGRIAVPGQLPPSGGGGGGGGAKPPADRTPQLIEEFNAIVAIGQAEDKIRDLLFDGREILAAEFELEKQIADIERDRAKAIIGANNEGEKALYTSIAEARIVDARLKTEDNIREIKQKRFEEELQVAEAVRSSVQVFTDLRQEQDAELQYTKTYLRLISEGVLPTEAARLANFDKLVAQQLQVVDTQIAITQAAITEATARGLSTKALQDQLDLLNQKRTGITGAAALGPGIAAPELTPAEKITENIGKLKEEVVALTNLGRIATDIAGGVSNAFMEAFTGLVTGAMTAREALASFFQSVGDMFISMATEIIAKQMTMIVLQSILKALGGFGGGGGGGGGNAATALGSNPNVAAYAPLADGGVFGSNFATFAKGGIVGQPTLFKFADGGTTRTGLMGEAGPEAIMPLKRDGSGRLGVNASGLREAMAGGPGASGGTTFNMSFETTNIAGVEYVSRDQLEQAMAETRRSAANDGAQRGMTMTLDRIKQSPQTRNRIGIR